MKPIKISIIIPAYNEAGNIQNIIQQIFACYPHAEVIVVDDGSTDHTNEIARSAGAIVYQHPYNIGNGAAIKSGIRIATGDILVFMDGDGQHNPADIQRLLNLFPDYDMVVGARSLQGQASLGRAIGNKLFNLLASYVAKFPVQDLTSGFRAIKANIARSFIHLLPNSYSYPTTLTLAILRTGRTLKYISIDAKMRKQGKSQIKILKDGVKFFMIIVRICTIYSPMRVFLPVSFLMFMLGIMRYFYTFMTTNRFTNMSALLLVTAVIIFMMGLISEQICQMRFDHHELDQNFPIQKPPQQLTLNHQISSDEQ